MKNATEKVKKPIPHKKIIIAVILIAIAFFGAFFVFFILQVALNTESPIVVVISGSMEPTIHKGDLLFVAGVPPEDIKSGTAIDKNGDVIVFDARGLWAGAPQDPIVHRVIGKYYDNVSDCWMFLTKGDANSLPDGELPGGTYFKEDYIIGVVIGGIPYIGWVKIILTEYNLLVPLLVVISVLLIVSIVRDVIKGDDEDKNNKSAKEENDINSHSQKED